MARITLGEAQAWLESTKLTLASLDAELVGQLEEEILGILSSTYDVSGWTSSANTPKLVRTAISKMYASYVLDRAYSENQDEGNDYAQRLKENSEMIITGLVEGRIILPEVPVPDTSRGASFYPTNASSALEPTSDDPSLGGPWFSLGKSF
jgi:hypothetical protein